MTWSHEASFGAEHCVGPLELWENVEEGKRVVEVRCNCGAVYWRQSYSFEMRWTTFKTVEHRKEKA